MAVWELENELSPDARTTGPFAVLKPRRLDGAARRARRVRRHIQRVAPATPRPGAPLEYPRTPEVSLGETGHALYGGDYGLLDPHTLEPRPDY